MLFLLFILGVCFTGSSEGADVLPDDLLNASVGGTVMFRTNLSPTETPFLFVSWSFYGSPIISPGSNIPSEYEGRITLFTSTGSLELRNLKLNDSGEYSVIIQPADDHQKTGNTRLEVYAPVSGVTVTPSTADLVEFNSSVSLSCSSSGSSLSFLWMNSSSEVTVSDRVQITDGGSNLTIVTVTRYDQGPYRCQVFNPVSSDSSDPVNLSVSYGPENIQLEVSPSKEHYEEGSDINLRCSAVSSPSAMFHWFLNEDLLPDSGPELRLMKVQTSQSGNYSCQAFNSRTLRYETSQPSAVSVLGRISNVVVTPNTTDLIEFNSSVRLSCSSSGSSLSFLWMNSSSEVTVSDRVQITDGGSTLTIVTVTRYDQGPYRCQVFNPISNGSGDPVNLSISYGPENIQLEVSPSKEHYEEGSDINLRCSAVSSPAAMFHWFLNEDLLPHTGSELRLMKVQTNQSGNYSCQAFNSRTLRYETSQSFLIPVHARVNNVLVTPNATDLIEFNSSVSLSCSSSGSSLSFLWMNSSSEVTVSDRVQITDGGSTLTIVSVTRYEEGSYSCRVFNPISEGISLSVSLSINYGPEEITLTISPSKTHYEEGSNIQMSCRTLSKPAAMFHWFLNGDLLPDSGEKLMLRNVQTSQSGNYSCQAFNSRTLRYQTSQYSAVVVLGGSSGLSAGAIAGILLVCLVLVAGIGVGYYIHRRKKSKNKSSDGNISTVTGGDKRVNAANASEELHYADLKFSKKNNRRKVRPQSENTSTIYAVIKVNNSRPVESSSSDQGLNYANPIFLEDNNRGTVQLEPEDTPTNYAEIRVDKPPPPPPPTYNIHMQQMNRPASWTDVTGAQMYAQKPIPQVRGESSKPPVPPPPTYKVHMKQVTPQAGLNGSQMYAQVNKSQRP